ncbi:MAG: flagellar hook-basal body complex protein, partial [Oscillospiraceae bacterium]
MSWRAARMTVFRRRTIRKGLNTMTGAMYAAVSGLKNHMNKLNVIGNNVANVNTFGYKAGRVTFTEALYTSVRSGSDGTGSLGGTNPAQMGYGVQIGTIDLDMGTKNYVPTGGPLHCMINGDGFIMTGDKNGNVSSGAAVKDLNLSRLGDLGFDQDGYLVDGRGQVVYGFI